MKQYAIVLAALMPLAGSACQGQETRQEVADAKTVTLVVSGMT